ncbi:MAG: hypothetical protein ACOCSE_00840 [Chitinivibrionales bacterium]
MNKAAALSLCCKGKGLAYLIRTCILPVLVAASCFHASAEDRVRDAEAGNTKSSSKTEDSGSVSGAEESKSSPSDSAAEAIGDTGADSDTLAGLSSEVDDDTAEAVRGVGEDKDSSVVSKREDSGSVSGAEESKSSPSDSAAEAIGDTGADSDTLAGFSKGLPQDSVEGVSDTGDTLREIPLFSIGAGWTVGGLEIFRVWRRSLPDKESISEYYEAVSEDSAVFSNYEVMYQPEKYAVSFPVTFSFVPVVKERYYIKPYLLYSWMYKRFKAKGDIDTSGSWKSERYISFHGLSIGVDLNLRIPGSYFSIENKKKTALTLGAGLTPVHTIRNKISETDQQDTDKKYFGLGIHWNTGITAFKFFDTRGGLRSSVLYSGTYAFRFKRGGRTIQGSDLSGRESDSEDLEFVRHSFLLMFELSFGERSAAE